MNQETPIPQRADQHSDRRCVTVIGGGVIGLSVAWELARRQHQVTLIDAAALSNAESSNAVSSNAVSPSPPSSTSWTAGGILPPANFTGATDPMDQLRGYSHRLWPRWAAELQDQTGIDLGLIRCGGFYLAETPGEAASMVGMTSYWETLGISCEPIAREVLLERQPGLRSWVEQNPYIARHAERAAWWVEDEYQVRPPRVLKALRSACERLGVRRIEGRVTDVCCGEDACRIEYHVHPRSGLESRSEAEIFSSDEVVLCGGAATGFLSRQARLQESLIPVRGQMILLRSDEWRQPIVLNFGNRYVIARGDGLVLVGSCEEEVGFEPFTTPAMIDQIRAFANRVCPSLAAAELVRTWAGLRPMTFDGFPMIGRLPEHRRLHVASGHYRSGIHLSAATAVAIADGIERKNSFMDLSPFNVAKQQNQSARRSG